MKLVFWLLAGMLAVFVFFVARLHSVAHDAFHEMALFREALVLGMLPKQDVFAFTPTVNPSVHHEWGTGAILYLVTIGTGLGAWGLTVLRILLIALMWLCLYRVCRMRGGHPLLFGLLSVITFPMLWVGFPTVRAQLFTLVFISAQLWMHELDWRGRRAWVILWLAMLILWQNLHAGFVVGAGMIAFHSVERMAATWWRHKSLANVLQQNWHLLAAGPAAVMVLPINPYGWEYIPYLLKAITMPRPNITEWRPLWHTHAPWLTLLAFGIAIGLYAYAQRFNRLRRLHGSAFLGLSAYMALKHIRHGSIFGVVWLAYVPAWLSRTTFGRSLISALQDQRGLVIRCSQLLVLASVVFVTYHQAWRPRLPAKPLYSSVCYPVGAIEYLRETSFSGNLLTPFHAGSYASWMMYPQVRVSLDGRYEVAYQDHVMPAHDRFYAAKDSELSLLRDSQADALLIHREARAFQPILAAVHADKEDHQEDDSPTELSSKAVAWLQSDWQLAYIDDQYAVYLRRTHNWQPEGFPLVDRTQEKLPDAADRAFTEDQGHWHRVRQRRLAQR